ncbi:MAG TPA: response regulator [Candidatus Angelobacter sp.]|nr:response regulator [Candidatus Angelobacter sp.]
MATSKSLGVTVPTRLLFVDDEAGIRQTLKPILEQHGFEVTTASTVPEALETLNHANFDVLLSDLNIGQPGDGFTVVSAMRRVQPEAATFILTGYPDFDTALQAIRSQVDDYLLKPMDVPTLIEVIQRRIEKRRPLPPLKPLKRVSELIRERESELAQQWLALVKSHPELMTIRMPDKSRIDHLPGVLEELARRVDVQSEETSKPAKTAAAEHGKERARQGYTIPLIVIEMRLLQRVLSFVLQRNLIRMDLSTVIRDMMEVGESLHEQLEFSIRGFQQTSREAA